MRWKAAKILTNTVQIDRQVITSQVAGLLRVSAG